MLQAAASWLITLLPLVDLGGEPEEVTRWGNAHRKFIPTSVYPTSDGFIYIALGSNAQWERLTAIDGFGLLAAGGRRDTAEIRYAEREDIYREIGAVTARHTRDAMAALLAAAKIPNAAINTVHQVHALEAIRAKMTETTVPGTGKTVRMQPMAVDLPGAARDFPFPANYGAHTRAVLAEAGYTADEVDALVNAGAAA